nr:uncharacterized protein CTRU02_11361 [Colletotrichum truncatum]KAF6786103.1 hypothetical protein CTRU02_11361 [Colletotrichum truncatum]
MPTTTQCTASFMALIKTATRSTETCPESLAHSSREADGKDLKVVRENLFCQPQFLLSPRVLRPAGSMQERTATDWELSLFRWAIIKDLASARPMVSEQSLFNVLYVI